MAGCNAGRIRLPRLERRDAINMSGISGYTACDWGDDYFHFLLFGTLYYPVG